MKTSIHLVQDFHEAFGCRIQYKPTLNPLANAQAVLAVSQQMAKLADRCRVWAANYMGSEDGEVWVRLNLIQEELSELTEALAQGDRVAVLDALTDLQYVIDGTYLSFGLHEYKNAAFREVHRSNMTKLDENGRPVLGDSGRVLKPDTYEPPDLESVLAGTK